MSGATVSINKKWDDGTLVQIGGVGATDFLQNLAEFVGSETADELVKKIGNSFTPASAGESWGNPPVPSFQQAQQNVQNTFPNAAPVQQQAAHQAALQAPDGPAPIGANGRPKKWVPAGVSKKTGRPYAAFWAENDR